MVWLPIPDKYTRMHSHRQLPFYIDNTMQTQMFERSSLTKIVDTNYMVWEPKWRNCFEEIFGTPIFVPLESHFHFQYFF